MTPQVRTQITWAGGPGVVFDALIAEAPTYTAEVPSAPTEKGYRADTCTRRPCSLALEAAVTEVSVELGTAKPGRVDQVRGQLLKLQAEGTLVSVLTGGGFYRDMVLERVSWVRDSHPNTLKFSLNLVETRIASTKTVAGEELPGDRAARQRKAPEAQAKVKDGTKRPPKRSALLESDVVRQGLDGVGLVQ